MLKNEDWLNLVFFLWKYFVEAYKEFLEHLIFLILLWRWNVLLTKVFLFFFFMHFLWTLEFHWLFLTTLVMMVVIATMTPLTIRMVTTARWLTLVMVTTITRWLVVLMVTTMPGTPWWRWQQWHVNKSWWWWPHWHANKPRSLWPH